MENAPAVADLMGRDEILDTVCAAVTRDGGALILGGSGVGKTALLKASAARLRTDFHTVYIRATALSSNTPYGALASLVARLPDAAGGPVRLLRGLDRSLAERSNGRPVLLAVDNADQLDRLSSMVLSQLLRRRSVSVLAAASVHWEAGHELMELWSEGLLARVDLEPLSERHTRRLMQQMLGRPVSSLAAASLWRESEGNPRFIQLLTRAQVRSGTLALRGPVWVRTQAPTQLGDVAEVADAVLGRLTEQERRLVEILALSVSLPLGTVLELVPSPVVDGLEERQIVRVDGPGPRVRFAGRSAGTAIALTMRPGRRRELWEAVSGRVDPLVLPPAELGAFTGWALSCGEVPGPVQLLRAAQAANTEGDARGALKLITAVPSGGRTQALVLEEARALRATGDLAGLVGLIRDAAPKPEDRATYVPLMQLYAFALARLQGGGDAGHVLSAAAASAPPGGDGPEQQAVIAVGLASLAADYGSLRDVPAGLDSLAAEPHLSPGTRFQLGALHAYTLALSGQGTEAVDALEKTGSPDGYPLAAGAAEEAWTRIFDTCILTGELERAAGFVKAFGDSGMRPSTRGSAGELAVAVLAAWQGQDRVAEEALTGGIGQLGIHDPQDLLPLARALSAHVRRRQGREMEAALLPGPPAYRHPYFRTFQLRYFSILAAAVDDHERCRILRLEAADALRNGHTAAALLFLAAALQANDHEAAAAVLETEAQGRFAARLREHAAGLLEGNASRLAEAAKGFAELGQYPLCGAAARAAAAVLPADQSERGLARTIRGLMNLSLRRMEHIGGRTLGELTVFEADLAHRAVTAATTSQIARELNLSPRTIEWHLAKIFAKLHVSGRAELAEILA